MATSKFSENRLINFKKFTDERGTLVPIESKLDIPFKLKVFQTFTVVTTHSSTKINSIR